jgi:hypothetical protein
MKIASGSSCNTHRVGSGLCSLQALEIILSGENSNFRILRIKNKPFSQRFPFPVYTLDL